MRDLGSRAPFLLLTLTVFWGCTSGSSGYPDVNNPMAVQTQAVCHQCGKPVASSDASQQLKLGAAEYIVCSESCRKKQIAWHESQFGKPK